MSTVTAPPPNSFLGSVKFFNATKGYGFIKPLGPPSPDVFVHAVDLRPAIAERGTLCTGEYVQFELGPAMEGKRPKAVNVTGVLGGPLLCDHGRVTFRSHASVTDAGVGGADAATEVTRIIESA